MKTNSACQLPLSSLSFFTVYWLMKIESRDPHVLLVRLERVATIKYNTKMSSLRNLIDEYIVGWMGGHYTTCIEESDQNDPEVLVIVVKNDHKICFHIAVTCSNTDIENAKAVCSQAVLYRTMENDPEVYFSVYDSRNQVVFFCLCDPSKQEFEDVSYYSVQVEAGKIAEWLKTYIVSNMEVLS
ncbi:hypothetical protein GQ44DRAFT_434805 [Phaeosphaeriaceae sp. PMI808]|nr:hypothetical protein GQ44DRAFT_434805 [Phaeosphaeriaceae sp. PMI808]